MTTTDSAADATAVCAGGAISPAATAQAVANLSGGAGQYTIVVSKDTTAAMNYAMEFHCHNAAGVELLAPGPAGQSGAAQEIDRIMDN
ncbi:MAG: hypothetical protein ABL933_11775 [Methyloglobulus sp.]|nr:hypothetical protein [Methyloglobulus sp.]